MKKKKERKHEEKRKQEEKRKRKKEIIAWQKAVHPLTVFYLSSFVNDELLSLYVLVTNML